MCLGIVDVGLIALDLRGQLVDERLLRIDRLGGPSLLLRQRYRALQVELRVAKRGFVLRLLGLCLGKGCFVGPGIDLDQNVAFI